MASGEIDVRAGTEHSGRLPLRGLLAWGLGAGFFFLAFLQGVSPSVMVEELMRDFAVSATMQLPIGLMIDRIGPRLLLTLFALLCVAGNLIFAIADTVTAAYLGRISLVPARPPVGSARWRTPRAGCPRGASPFFAGLGQVFGIAGGVFGQSPLSLAGGMPFRITATPDGTA